MIKILLSHEAITTLNLSSSIHFNAKKTFSYKWWLPARAGRKGKTMNKNKFYEVSSMLMWIGMILLFLSTFWWY